MELSATLQNKIIQFLLSIPNIHDSPSQQALIFKAGLDIELQNQILVGKPAAQFVPLLVMTLLNHETLNDGRYAIEALLLAVKDYIGQEKKIYCESLLQEFYEYTKSRSERQSNLANELLSGFCPGIKKDIIEDRYKELQELYHLLFRKIAKVEKALVLETDAIIQFKYEEYLKQYRQQLVEIERKLDVFEHHNVDLYFSNGNQCYDSGKFEKALEEYTKTIEAIEYYPNYARTYFNRGNTYVQLNSFDEALGDFTKAIQLNPDYELAYLNRGYLYAKQGDYFSVVEDSTKALDINPHNVIAYLLRGITYAKLNYFDKAMEDSMKAVETAPNDIMSYLLRGVIYTHGDSSSIDKAIEDFNVAISLNPKDPIIYFNYGVALVKLKQFEAAINNFTKAIEFELNYKAAYFNRGVVYLYLGDFRDALIDFAKVFDDATQQSIKEFMSIIYLKKFKDYFKVVKEIHGNVSDNHLTLFDFDNSLLHRDDFMNKSLETCLELSDLSNFTYWKSLDNISQNMLFGNVYYAETRREFHKYLDTLNKKAMNSLKNYKDCKFNTKNFRNRRKGK